MTRQERKTVAKFLNDMAPTQTHEMRRAFQDAAVEIERGWGMPENWARLLLQRDRERGEHALEAMLKWFEEHDGKADDFGRLYIVIDASKALGRE